MCAACGKEAAAASVAIAATKAPAKSEFFFIAAHAKSFLIVILPLFGCI